MSNCLRKKKKMEPLGYSKQELLSIQQKAKQKSNADKLIEESSANIRLIIYQILHDKFGFGQKRIIRVENTIDEYLNTVSSGKMTAGELQYYMKEKCKIDVKEEVNKVPFRECFALTERKVNPASMPTAGKYILASICNYFSLLGVCLKTQFKFSARQINEVYEWIRFYINTLSRVKQFDLTIRDIAECLAEECNYCDSRFVGA